MAKTGGRKLELFSSLSLFLFLLCSLWFSYQASDSFQRLRELTGHYQTRAFLQFLLQSPEDSPEWKGEFEAYLAKLNSTPHGSELIKELLLEQLAASRLDKDVLEGKSQELALANSRFFDEEIVRQRAEVDGQITLVLWSSLGALASLAVLMLSTRARHHQGGQAQSSLPISFTEVALRSTSTDGNTKPSVRGYTERVLQSLSNYLILCDPEGRMQTVNESLCDSLGYEKGELLGTSLSKIITKDEALNSPEFRGEATLRTKSGRQVDVILSRSIVNDDQGQLNGLVVVAQDISQLKRAEERLRKSQRRLKSLLEKLVTTQEDERKRVARELHDGMLQAVIAAELQFKSYLRRGQKKGDLPNPQKLEAGIECLSEAVSEGRRLIHDLRPPTLDKFGLVDSVKHELDKLGRDMSCPIRVSCRNEAEEIPQSLENAVYRICQEACNNIRKHSKPTEIQAELIIDTEVLTLTVSDNGSGFDTSVNKPDGIGMKSMRERAELHGGSLSVESTVGQGTTITAILPLQPSDESRV